MATRFSNTLIAANDTSAHLQGWATFVENTLVTTGGWVVTGDAGQTPPGSLVGPPGAGNTKVGYRVYRMADTLQATAPVFLRVDFGSGGAINTPAMWFTIGGASDGAGNITNVYLPATQIQSAGNSTTQANNSYGSADTNRFTIAMFIQATVTTCWYVVTLERSKDINGNDTSDGLILTYPETGFGGLKFCQYIILTLGPQPPLEIGVSYVLTTQNPTQVFTPGNLGVGILIPFKGVSQQPGMNVMFANSSDVAAEGSFTMTIYGNTHTYQQVRMQPIREGSATNFLDANGRVCIRYE